MSIRSSLDKSYRHIARVHCNIDMAQVVDNLSHRWQGHVQHAYSIPWLLMSWWHNKPRHQYPSMPLTHFWNILVSAAQRLKHGGLNKMAKILQMTFSITFSSKTKNFHFDFPLPLTTQNVVCERWQFCLDLNVLMIFYTRNGNPLPWYISLPQSHTQCWEYHIFKHNLYNILLYLFYIIYHTTGYISNEAQGSTFPLYPYAHVKSLGTKPSPTSSVRKDFNYLCHICTKKWWKMLTYF